MFFIMFGFLKCLFASNELFPDKNETNNVLADNIKVHFRLERNILGKQKFKAQFAIDQTFTKQQNNTHSI